MEEVGHELTKHIIRPKLSSVLPSAGFLLSCQNIGGGWWDLGSS